MPGQWPIGCLQVKEAALKQVERETKQIDGWMTEFSLTLTSTGVVCFPGDLNALQNIQRV